MFRALSTFFILALVGAGFNQFLILPLYANLVLHLGSVFTFIGLYLLGLRWALLISVIISLPFVFSVDSYFMPFLLFLEIGMVGFFVNRRWSIIYADLLFWLLIGMPVSFIAFQVFNPTATDFVISTMLKQAINGLLYVSIASIILPFISTFRQVRIRDKSLPKMRNVIQTKLVMAIVGTSILVGIIASEYSVRKQETSLNKSLKWQADDAALFTENYLNTHKSIIQNIARIKTNISLEQSQFKEIMKLFQANNKGFISMLAADLNGHVTIAAPHSFDEMLKKNALNMTVADRDYFINAIKNNSLYVSQAFLGRGFGNDMIVAISAPYKDKENNEVEGIIEGSLNLAQLSSIDDKVSLLNGASVVLVDSNHRVIFASEILKLKVLSQFKLAKTSGNYNAAIPVGEVSSDNKKMDMFYHRQKLSNDWQVYILQNPSFLIVDFSYYYFFILLLAVVLSIFSYFLAHHVADVIAKPIEDITTLFSKNNNQKFLELKEPSNSTFEAHCLFESLQETQNLQMSFQDQLKNKVDIQTKQLNETNQQLLIAKEEAQASNRLKSEFLANMSHEIRTPMNGVLGMLNLLTTSQLDTNQKRKISLAKSSAESLLILINDVLDLSKIEAGKLELEIIEFNLIDMLGDIVSSVALNAQYKGLELVLDLSEVEYSFVKGDPNRLRQVITNLLSNAIKFTEQGDIQLTASLSLTKLGQMKFCCCISDSGIGISEEQIGHLFEAFRQVDASTTRKYGGTGLGLTISKQICELMHGNIQVKSQVGKGSDFSFEVILNQSDIKHTIKLPSEVSNLNILIVDNNLKSRNALRKQLETWGVKVSSVKNSAEAISICLNQYNSSINPPFSGVLINNEIDANDGLSLIRTFRQHSELATMSVVLMIPVSSKEILKVDHIDGYLGYIEKPFVINDLLIAINAISNGTIIGNKDRTHLNYRNTATHLVKDNNNEDAFFADTLKFKDTNILVVEDNIVNQEVIIGILENFGLSADVVSNGLEAIEIIKTNIQPYNILLMDCQMPVMDGYEATRRIRLGESGEANNNVTIIAMTANAMEGDKDKCIQSGMNDYLSKPIEIEAFYQCLLKWISNNNELSKAEHNNSCNSSFNENKTVETLSLHNELVNKVVWNYDSLLKRMMGNKKLLNKAITMFLKEKNKMLEEVETAINNNSIEDIVTRSHTIKGISANLSGEIVAEYAHQIELAARSNNQEKISEIYAQFLLDFNIFSETISTYLSADSDI